jgi:hypothetical protein
MFRIFVDSAGLIFHPQGFGDRLESRPGGERESSERRRSF